MKCERCGAPFEGKRRNARFCGRNCKERARDARLGRNNRYALRYPDRARVRYWRRYGIAATFTYADYCTLLSQQDGRCAICRHPPGRVALAADHDHATGLVRGLLCTDCNLLLGRARDDEQRLRSAADYLNLFKSKANA